MILMNEQNYLAEIGKLLNISYQGGILNAVGCNYSYRS